MSQPQSKSWITIATWILQIAVAVLLLQTLFFKLTYAPATQVIFEPLGGRPAATITALAELVVALLLLTPGTWLSRIEPDCSRAADEVRGWTDTGIWLGFANSLGAVMALGVIGGAIFTHLTVLGINIPVAPGSTETDGGTLFAMAVFIALASAAIAFLRRRELIGFKDTVLALLHRNAEPAAQAIRH
ncbi:MAG: hypothetical protein AAF333_18925 [Planctomycetota bacterium]